MHPLHHRPLQILYHILYLKSKQNTVYTGITGRFLPVPEQRFVVDMHTWSRDHLGTFFRSAKKSNSEFKLFCCLRARSRLRNSSPLHWGRNLLIGSALFNSKKRDGLIRGRDGGFIITERAHTSSSESRVMGERHQVLHVHPLRCYISSSAPRNDLRMFYTSSVLAQFNYVPHHYLYINLLIYTGHELTFDSAL